MPACSLRTLLVLALGYRLAVVALLELFTAPKLLFDVSPDDVLPRTSWLQPFVRWDVLWFLPVAQRGHYATEQETAFGWGWIGVMRAAGQIVHRSKGGQGSLSVEDLVLGGVIVSWAAGIAATALFYHLTVRLTRSRSFAAASTVLYILSPSPAALVSPYTEPLYACLTFVGMLSTVESRTVGRSRAGCFALLGAATAAFAGATAVRPTGVINAGYLVWYLVIEPLLQGRRQPLKTAGRLLLATALSLTVAAPFIHAQMDFYTQFCTLTAPGGLPSWCHAARVPLLYTHVQKQYWGVGFLAYWEFKQIPNFAIAAPVYGLLAVHHSAYLRRGLPSTIARVVRLSPTPPAKHAPFFSPALKPFVLHSAALTLLLALNSHVQIALRLAQTNPVYYWASAGLMGADDLPGWVTGGGDEEKDGQKREVLRVPWVRDAGRRYLQWVLSWGLCAVALWAGFLPPA